MQLVSSWNLHYAVNSHEKLGMRGWVPRLVPQIQKASLLICFAWGTMPRGYQGLPLALCSVSSDGLGGLYGMSGINLPSAECKATALPAVYYCPGPQKG